jgi:hypothetical protein
MEHARKSREPVSTVSFLNDGDDTASESKRLRKTRLETPELFDPDPFTIGSGIFTALAGGGAFLEARRQR